MEKRPLEYCHECGSPTGKAGPHDDSIYTPGGVGPFCEDCYDDWREEELERADELRTQLAAEVAEREKDETEIQRLKREVNDLTEQIWNGCDPSSDSRDWRIPYPEVVKKDPESP